MALPFSALGFVQVIWGLLFLATRAAEWRREEITMEEPKEVFQKIEHFIVRLKLLEEDQAERETQDAVRSINITGATEARVMENLNLSLHIQGSPPLSLCWLIKTECIPLGGDQCHLVVMNSTQYYLNHTFNNAGQYCLSIRVENRVNILQSYQEIQIRPSGIPTLFFVLPCVILLLATLGLAVYMTFRSPVQQKDLVEVADFDFSPTSTKKPSSPDGAAAKFAAKPASSGRLRNLALQPKSTIASFSPSANPDSRTVPERPPTPTPNTRTSGWGGVSSDFALPLLSAS